MAKKYVITESQYKEVLAKLNLNENEMNEMFFDGMGKDFKVIDMYLEGEDDYQVVVVECLIEGGNKVHCKLDWDDLETLGENPDSLLAQFQTFKDVNDAVHNMVADKISGL